MSLLENEMNMRKYLIIIAALLLPNEAMKGQSFETTDNAGAVKTNSFWSDWFVQMDLDMSLQNPYGYNFSHVFPNGKSFGVDVAIGKWFTPQVGVRGKLNWENGIGLFRNDHANWLAPFDEPGKNMDKGGYVGLYGDALLNLHNFFGSYRPERAWNLSAYPRVGVNYNFGVSKGSLVIGAGVLNTYRLNDRWSLYADLAYMLSGSGFVGMTKEEGGTGTGSNSNGYFSLGLGAQLNLGKSHTDEHSVNTNRFWHNWFVQIGTDMSLQNPYGCNFSEVFPNGKTFGMNVAVGKWFTPEYGLRGRVNWENGLIENKSLKWVPPVEDPGKNYDDHGYALLSLEALVNITNVFIGYNADKKWHTTAFFRAGLITHFALNSGSPVLGAGIEQSYRLNDRLSLFAAAGYQFTTSESSVSITGMDIGEGSNGFFNIDLGVSIDLGKRTWHKE